MEEKKEEFKYTESYMQMHLSHFFAFNTVKYDVDNLYIFGWESDKFIKTRSGLIYEFEVKVSKSDFKNDFKNKKDKHIILEGEEKYGDKYLPKYYDCLEENKKRGQWAEMSFRKHADNDPYYLVGGHKRPNYFYYCVPPNMITVDEVPWYAGLVYIDEKGVITIAKKAPKLHGDKIDDNKLGLGEKFYFYMDNWRQKCKSAWRENATLRKQLQEEVDEKGHEMTYEQMKMFYDLYNEERANFIKREAELTHKNDEIWRYIHRLVNKIKEYDKDFNEWKFRKEFEES